MNIEGAFLVFTRSYTRCVLMDCPRGRKIVRILISIALGLLFASPEGFATTVRPPTFEELVARADYVVRAETIEVRSEWRGDGATRRIVTIVKLRVDRVIVGSAPETVELEFLGGRVGGRTLTVTDQPQFQRADIDVLFVENNGRQVSPLVNMMYGRYPVVRDPRDPAVELVAREDGSPLRSTADVSQPLHSAANGSASSLANRSGELLSLEAFESEIRNTATRVRRDQRRP